MCSTAKLITVELFCLKDILQSSRRLFCPVRSRYIVIKRDTILKRNWLTKFNYGFKRLTDKLLSWFHFAWTLLESITKQFQNFTQYLFVSYFTWVCPSQIIQSYKRNIFSNLSFSFLHRIFQPWIFLRVLPAGYQKILFGFYPKKYFNRDFVNSIFLLQPCKVTW